MRVSYIEMAKEPVIQTNKFLEQLLPFCGFCPEFERPAREEPDPGENQALLSGPRGAR